MLNTERSRSHEHHEEAMKHVVSVGVLLAASLTCRADEAVLYVPDKLSGKVPVMLAVNGHDRNGKAADYKQTRCINLAKRGMLVLNVEWFGMGQLRRPGDRHGCMNQLDLCGTSGLAPFYL